MHQLCPDPNQSRFWTNNPDNRRNPRSPNRTNNNEGKRKHNKKRNSRGSLHLEVSLRRMRKQGGLQHTKKERSLQSTRGHQAHKPTNKRYTSSGPRLSNRLRDPTNPRGPRQRCLFTPPRNRALRRYDNRNNTEYDNNNKHSAERRQLS